MMEYLPQIIILFSIVVTGVVVVINSANPTLLQSLKPVVHACVGLSGAVIYFYTFAYLQEVMRVLRSGRVKQHGGYFYVIALPIIVMVLFTTPALVLELAVPGYGWLPWMFISGAVWGVVFFGSMWFHARIRSRLLPASKPDTQTTHPQRDDGYSQRRIDLRQRVNPGNSAQVSCESGFPHIQKKLRYKIVLYEGIKIVGFKKIPYKMQDDQQRLKKC